MLDITDMLLLCNKIVGEILEDLEELGTERARCNYTDKQVDDLHLNRCRSGYCVNRPDLTKEQRSMLVKYKNRVKRGLRND